MMDIPYSGMLIPVGINASHTTPHRLIHYNHYSPVLGVDGEIYTRFYTSLLVTNQLPLIWYMDMGNIMILISL